MANTLRFKRGLVAGIPTGVAGEPLFTTDTFDLYIGNGTTNTRFQKYIASGTTAQYLRGDGSLATFPTNIVTGTGTTNYLPKFTGASTLGNSSVQDDATKITLGISTYAVSDFRFGADYAGPNTSLMKWQGSGALIPNSLGIFTWGDAKDIQIGGANVYFRTEAGTQRMVLTSGGNLGLGVTPSAWGSSYKAMQIGQQSAFFGYAGNLTWVGTNVYVDSSDVARYITTASASLYRQNLGAHAWYNAPSGTAGNTITFTQPMTLTANGRLLLGTTGEQTYRLAVAGDVKFDADAATNGFYWDNTNKRLGLGTNAPSEKLHLVGGNARFDSANINVVARDTGTGYAIFAAIGQNATGAILDSGVHGATANGIMTGAPANAGVIGTRGSHELHFGTNGNSRMMISTGGSVGIGTTSPSGVFHAQATNSGIFFDLTTAYTPKIKAAGTISDLQIESVGSGGNIVLGAPGATSIMQFFVNGTLGTGERMRIFSDGNIGIATGSTNTGEKLQVNGTMKVTGASTFARITATTSSIILDYNSGILYHFGGSGDYYQYIDGANYRIANRTPTGSLSFATNDTNRLTIASTGAATFSSSVTAGGNLLLTDGTAATIGAINLIRTGTSPVASRLTFGTDGTGYSFAIGKNQAGTVTDLLKIADSGLATFTDNARFSNLKGCIFVQTGGTLLGSISMDSSNSVTIDNNGFSGLSVGSNYTMTAGNLGIGHNGFGTSATRTLSVLSGTAPSTSPADSFQMYSNDVVAGNAAPHFRTENGAVIKLYQETTAVGNSTISVGGGSAVLDDTEFGGYTLRQVVKALQNQGILA